MNQSELKSEYLPTTSVLKPVIFSALILISGIIIGAGLTLIITGGPSTQKSLPPGPEYMSGRMVERIVRELHLSGQQQEQLRPIVQQHMKAMDDIRRQARPEISKELKQMNEEILSILDGPQKEIWQDRIQRMQEHFIRMRHHRGPGDERRNRRHPERRPSERFRKNRPPESQFPPGEKPPIDGITPPELNPPPEMPPGK